MQRAFSASTEASEDRLYRVVSDLGTYPAWLDLVDRAEPCGTDGGQPNDDGPAWSVTLRARLGPLARSKRLRMVRTVDDGRRVRFERREVDGRDHAPWVLTADVEPCDGESGGPHRSKVTVDLHYGGSLWSGLLDAVLASAADDATDRLQAYVAANA